MLDWALAMIASIGIITQGWLMRRIIGSWLAPAGLSALLWFFYTFVPLILFPDVPVRPSAVWFIFLLVTMFSVSGCFFNWRVAWRTNRAKAPIEFSIYQSPLLRRLFYVLTMVAMTMFLINSYHQGITIHDLIYNLYESANQYMSRRYADELDENIYSKLGICLSYLATSLGGLLVVRARSLERGLIVVLSFLPSIFVMVTQSARGMLFLSIAFFLGTVLVARISSHTLRLWDRGNLRKFALYGLILVPLVATSFMSRVVYNSDDREYVVDFLRRSFGSYSCGHLFAFSDWFSHRTEHSSIGSYEPEPRANGFFTFMAIFRWFGSARQVPPGVYGEYFNFEDALITNIYTMFRGMIVDFGLLGAPFFALMSGSFFHLSFYIMLTIRRPVLTVAIYVFMVGCIYISFGVSLLTWNTPLIALALLSGVLYINRLSWHRRSSEGALLRL